MLKQALFVAAATVFLSSLATTANAQCRQYAATNCGAAYCRVGLFPRLGLFARCRYASYAPTRPSTLTTTPEKVEYIPTDEGNVGVEEYREAKKKNAPLASAFLAAANRIRARHGLPALTCDANLDAGCQYQARICQNYGALIHGSGAEILAYNYSGFDAALAQWLNSPAHRAHLLSGSYRTAGVAVVRGADGRVWCAMRFR